MTDNKTLGDNSKKFLFDMNRFDDDFLAEEEDLPPPPPTFSEEELAAAKKAAYDEGYAQAQKDETQSRDQHIANTLSNILKNIAPFFDEEEKRATKYEQEAVNLSAKIFKTVFPYYSQLHGMDELKSMLAHVLEKQRVTKTIQIFVCPDIVEGIKNHVNKIELSHNNTVLEVIGDETLTGTACRLAWADGGALHTPQKTADQTLAILQETLAQDGFKSHDEEVENNTQSTDAEKCDTVEDGSGKDTTSAERENVRQSTEKAGEDGEAG